MVLRNARIANLPVQFKRKNNPTCESKMYPVEQALHVRGGQTQLHALESQLMPEARHVARAT